MSDLRVISLGGGVQSTTLAAMSALGELPPVDAVIFANTGWERAGTLAYLETFIPWLESHGLKFYEVSDQRMQEEIWQGTEHIYIPAYSMRGSRGQLARQCTDRLKIRPINRLIRQLLKACSGKSAEVWLGITIDEVERMKPAHVKYITNRWPLIERRMYRWDCATWLTEHNLGVPPKSACVGCPYHSRHEWRSIRENKTEWAEVCEFDSRIRNRLLPGELFLNSDRVPLPELDLSTPEDRGQLPLF